MKRNLLGGVALAAMLALAGANSALAGKSDDTLRWSSKLSIDTMDPYYQTNNEAIYDNGWLVWDTLVYQDPESGDYQPLLATEWKWADDKTFNVKLRDDVKWHDGQPFTADDVVYTINYIVDPANKVSRPSDSNWMAGAEKVGPHEVNIRLKAPFAPALQYLSRMIMMLPDGFYGPGGVAGANGRLVGTGPYKVSKFTPGDSIEMELTHAYFADSPKGQPTIGKIVYRAIPDQTTQLAELMGGRLDWVWNVPASQFDKLGTLPNIETQSVETQRISVLSFNVANKDPKNPLLDLKVRQAIAHAIDVEALTTNVIGPGATVLHTPCYPKFVGCDGSATVDFNFDPDLAKKLLAEAGYPDGLTLRLVSVNQRPQEWTLALTNYLNAIGIKTEVEFLEFTAVRQRLIDNKADLYIGTFSNASMQDVSSIWGRFLGGTADDIAKDPELIKKIEAAGSELDSAKRLELYKDVQLTIANNLYWLPLYNTPARFAFTKDLDWHGSADEITRFTSAKWK